jgi:hypothetical protein
MRRAPLAVLASCLFLLLAGCGKEPAAGPPKPAADDPLVGFWESTDREQGGMGYFMSLRADGQYFAGMGVMVHVKWFLVGDTLELRNPAGEPENRVVFSLDWNGEQVHFRDADGNDVVRTRVGAAPSVDKPLVGVWRFTHPNGAIAYERYLPDGTMYLRIPNPNTVQPGAWHRQDDRLVLAPMGGPVASSPVTVEGDVLTMDDGNGKKREMKRTDAWYISP